MILRPNVRRNRPAVRLAEGLGLKAAEETTEEADETGDDRRSEESQRAGARETTPKSATLKAAT